MSLPLDGVTVVALEQAIAAPFATRQLADLGARVIKIERPGVGDFARHYDTVVNGLSSHFVWTNRSKQSLTLDLKHPDALAVVHKLLETADVFIQNLAPGATGRLGLGAAALRQRYPRLIVCGISGYGEGGGYRDQKAYDLLVQAETGVIAVTGTEEAPAKVGVSIADIASGMYAYSGVLSALLRRERTGEGAALEVSMLEALGEWMGFPAYYTKYSGAQPARSGANHATIAPYGPFPTGDGRTVYLGIQNEREWASFCQVVLGQADLATDPRFTSNPLRVQHLADLHATIEGAFASLSYGTVVERLEAAQIAHAQQRTVAEFIDHPQLAERGRARTIESPAGPLWALLPPVEMAGEPPVMGPVPGVGEHTEAILRELGYTPAQITKLREEKAI
jgi:crotonobetainyl-CoA:carnitine CoA-transferase CaiB-like acyl-CoA transferase